MHLDVQFSYLPVVNFAMQQNHVPVIREILLRNTGPDELRQITVRVGFDPEFAEELLLHVESIAAGAEERIAPVDVRMSTSCLSQLTERLSGHIRVEVSAAGQTLFARTYEIALLAFDQWGGIAVLPEMLAAFVTPNHPAVSPLVRRACEILGSWSGSPAMDEYQTRDPNRVKQQMAALYEAITEERIAYCATPASFEESGQRVRLYDDILSNRLANCLDLALLYAGCLEAVGIHPLIVVVKGHAFAGGWLIPDSFADSVNDDVSLLTKRAAEGINELLLVETTCATAGNPLPFDGAVAAANDRLKQTEDFLLFVDVTRARHAPIRPLPLRVVRDGVPQFVEPAPADRESAAPATLSATDIIPDTGQTDVGKQTIWERKLLDLSLRNSLLNTRITRNTLQLISVRIGELEDALADGEEFQILERPQDWDNPLMSAGIYQTLHASDPIVDLVKSELRQRRLRSYLTDEALRNSLTYLYRTSRLSLEENGANTLYLALGLLKWLETPTSTRPRFAPILLLPIEIVRKSAVKGYVIRSRDEETMLNITLLEMLRQYFDIQIGGLDPLPRDGSGVDVSLILNTIRRAIMNHKGWDVEEQAIIGIFRFNKFIMWNDIHNNADKLRRNPIVASLLSGRLEWTPEAEEPAVTDLDESYPAEEIALPIGADSSQFEAICAAVNDRSFILHGPPGTGKSQTITNIIANALYKGKKVLFVAEKMAALQVVQHRLEAIGLAPFCLELHSNKAKKANVLAQLKRTTEVVKRKSNEEYRLEAGQINALRRELNAYVQVLHQKRQAGLSLYDCFSGYASVAYEGPLLDFSDDFLRRLDPTLRAACRRAVEEYRTACRICADPAHHPLREIGVTSCPPALRTAIRDELTTLADRLREEKELRRAMTPLLGGELPELTMQQDEALHDLVRTLLSAEEIPVGLLTAENLTEVGKLIGEAVRAGAERDRLRQQITTRFERRILEVDASLWERQWKSGEARWWLPRMLNRRNLRQQIRTYAKSSTELDPERFPELFTTLNAYRAAQQQIEQLGRTLSPLLGLLWNNGEAQWERLTAACETVERIEQSLLRMTRDIVRTTAAKRALRANLECGVQTFRILHAATLERFLALGGEITRLIAKLGEELQTTALTPTPDGDIETRSELTNRWLSHLDLLHDRAAYNRQRAEVMEAGLAPLVEAVETGRLAAEQVVDCYRKSLCRSYAEYILSQEPQMNTFHGVLFEEKIRRFRDLSRHFEQLTREELYARLAAGLPALQKEAAQSSEVGILQRNIRNGGRGTSIRRLFDQIPDLLTRMCPCLLMSPISVAQYIDAGRAPFDLVIFDEASQMPTSEAVGAIARGRNVIVVGDPNQMPPTDFFSTNHYDEANADKEDLESILDDCLALSIPSKHLLWHYRSRHESLIAFSNVKYYNNRLLTFPSPDDLTTKVHFEYVAGIYDRGSTRQNRAEAEAVVREIRTRLTDPQTPRRSIGVVTFNSNQQSLIEDLLNDLFREHPDLERTALECDEPIFIKNLENVQGDERDVILFSVGYGPDHTGRIALNFGPLNREGGWRRLNVAVSRARYEMKVFSALRADQIDLNRTSAEGVAGLKAFLEYAEKGRQALYCPTTAESRTNDGLLQDLAAELTDRGYGVRLNVGCSGYRIDLGIIDPEDPQRYLLGVLCDGYNHNATRTAHDRVVTQSGVLQALGWRLHHVWAMDWWENRQRTLETLVAAIEEARARRGEPTDRTNPPQPDASSDSTVPTRTEESEPIPGSGETATPGTPAAPTVPAAPAVLTDDVRLAPATEVETPVPAPVTTEGTAEHAEETKETEETEKADETTNPTDTADGFPAETDSYERPYRMAELDYTPITADLFAQGFCNAQALDKIRQVVRAEAPVSRSLLCRRVLNSFGITRMGPRLSSCMEQLLKRSGIRATGDGALFYWDAEQTPETCNTYRPDSGREALDIAPEEVSAAVCRILEEQGALPQEDLLRETARRFHFTRLGENVTASMMRGIAYAEKSGRIAISGNKVKAADPTPEA